MLKPIQKNPYREDTSSGSIWAMGFYAGQRSMSAPVSVTGRWWQWNSTKRIGFIMLENCKMFENEDGRWLSEEETREFE